MSFVIRRATINDLPALLRLETGFPGDRLHRKNFRHLLTRARADVWLVVADGGPIGNAIVLYRTNSRRAHLYSLVIEPQARGRGFAQTLIEVAQRSAAARGCLTMHLEVRCDNAPAIRLYRKLGYRVRQQLPRYYEDGQDGLRMETTLDQPAAPPRLAA